MKTFETYQVIWLAIFLFINHIFIYLFSFYSNRKKNVKKIYGITPNVRQLKAEFKNSLITTPIHSIIIGIFLFAGWLNISNEDFLTIIISFIVMFWWTELWHYISHRAMHAKWLVWIHKEHHKSYITNPMSAASFSILEKAIFTLGIVGFASIYSYYLPFSFNGLCLYYTFYFATNVLGHSNIEFRNAKYPFSLMGHVINSPSFHAMHHARYIKNYGLITSVFDRLFNTRWTDYDRVVKRAAEGKPLQRLSERP